MCRLRLGADLRGRVSLVNYDRLMFNLTLCVLGIGIGVLLDKVIGMH